MRSEEAAIDVPFILAVVNSGSSDGLSQVELHHRNLWMAANGRQLCVLKCFRRRLAERLEMLRELSRETRLRLRRLRLMIRPTQWHRWDLFKFSLAIAALVVLVGASISTVFTLLRNTAVFAEMPVAAFVTAALVAAIPVAGKLGLEVVCSELALKRMRMFLGWAALGLFCLWAVLLARLTGGLGGGLQDPLALAAPLESAGTGWPLSVHLQYLQLVVELLGTLACYSYADLLYQRAGPGKPIINPVYVIVFKRFVEAERAADADARQFGEGKGQLRELQAHREAFVGKARAQYLVLQQTRTRRDQLRSEYSHVLDSLDRELSGQRMPSLPDLYEKN